MTPPPRRLTEASLQWGAPGRADLFSSGILATAPGGHGTQFGVEVPTPVGPDAQAWVDARLAEGSDYIKIISEDGSAYGRQIPTLDRATIAALIKAAHARERLAVAHIGDQDGAFAAIEEGVDGLVHVFTDRAPEPAFAALAARRKAFVVPTLTVVESTTGTPSGQSLAEDPRLVPYLQAEEVRNLRTAFPRREGLDLANAQAAVRQLKAARVPILAGSDSPNPGTAHGASLHRELELLVAAGLTPIEALRAATSVPATAFRLKGRGRIARGLRADLVLVKGDLTADVTATRDILRVWKLGQEIPRPLAPPEAAATPAPAAQAPPSGEISGFDDDTLSATFGFGWTETTDAMAGGKSVVQKEIVSGGAGTDRSLAISGEIRQGFAFPWAGVMFFPGLRPMAPANLSAFAGISFQTKGDGGTYQIMVFATKLGRIPAVKTFATGPDWQRHTFSFAEFGVDGSDVTGLVFSGGPAVGTFRFQIDEVRLVTKEDR